MSTRTIRVDLNRHGAWEITLPNQLDPINCNPFMKQGARRIGSRPTGIPARSS